MKSGIIKGILKSPSTHSYVS